MKTNANFKSTELTTTLTSHFQGTINLARIKLIAFIVTALCKVQTVNFEKLANAFDTTSHCSSSLRRIQRFIAKYRLEADLIAKLIFKLLPVTGKHILTIDRTNWKYGGVDINVFMLGIVYQGVAFPLLFTMLPKRGNSNSAERIALVDRYIRLFGTESIDCLVADREFVGEQWMEFLNRNAIRYHIRIRNNFKVFLPHKNEEVKASWLFNDLALNQYKYYNKIVRIKGQDCYLSGTRIKGDFLIVVSFNKPQEAQHAYAKRWQIEMCFKAMKTSGFDIEKTHLQEIERIEKLVLLVMVAFVWCYKVGIYLHENVKPIRIKKHGRKAKSIFKYGLTYIANYLLNPNNQNKVNIFEFLSCT